jgi:hypothetical protein
MTKNIYCPMIHGGLNIDLKGHDGSLSYNQCCLSTTSMPVTLTTSTLWNDTPMQTIRQLNNSNQWLEG